MTQALGKPAGIQPWSALPSELAPALRAENGRLAADIVAEIRRQIPEYALVLNGPYASQILTGIEVALGQFVDQIADPTAPRDHCAETYRRLGRCELADGRSLDALQAAYRIGARVAWRRLGEFWQRMRLPVPTVCLLGEALFAHIDELAALSAEGYALAQARAAGTLERRRRRLLELLLTEPPVPWEAVTELAVLSQWQPPERVCAVAIDRPRGIDPRAPSRLPETILVDLEGTDPCLLVPVEELGDPSLRDAFCDWRAALGPSVALMDAPKSLRWARQALDLVRRGVLADGMPTDCSAHLSTLLLRSDEALVAELADRVLAPFAKLTVKQRERLGETLLAWLQTKGGAPEIAHRLGIHPQTVRYRLRQLQELYGDQLNDEDLRFDLEIALRATMPRRTG